MDPLQFLAALGATVIATFMTAPTCTYLERYVDSGQNDPSDFAFYSIAWGSALGLLAYCSPAAKWTLPAIVILVIGSITTATGVMRLARTLELSRQRGYESVALPVALDLIVFVSGLAVAYASFAVSPIAT